MQKITIKQPFMAVQPCEIEFDRFLLLIGEQASGKSTIAKLIYFFQKLPDDLLELSVKKQDDLRTELENAISNMFITWFGASILQDKVDIIFYYDMENNKTLEISIKSKIIKTKFGKNLLDNTFIFEQKEMYAELEKGVLGKIQQRENSLKMQSIMQKEFSIIDNRLFMIAGRSTTVNYSDFFEHLFFAEVSKNIQKKTETRQSIVDDFLMLEFLKRVISIKDNLKYWNNLIKKWKGDEVALGFLEEDDIRIILSEKMQPILKAYYSYDKNDKEILTVGNKNIKIPISQASSGQQEILRILQDILLVIKKAEPALRIIEEPEAHLYPLAQKEVVDLFALMLNANTNNRLIITTHSPYILACVNILLFAHDVPNEVVNSENEVKKIVPQAFWLDSKMFSVYAIGHDEAYCTNIKDAETGMIDQNYLDLISEQLGLQYQQLYTIILQNA